ncbi:hypothetical protein Tco_1213949 [Tanacetum coccineum]
MPDRRLLELEDQINFLLTGSRLMPRPSSIHVPQAYAEAVYSNPRPRNQNEPPKGDEERNNDNDVETSDDIEKPTRTEMGMPVKEAENGIKTKPIRKAKKKR